MLPGAEAKVQAPSGQRVAAPSTAVFRTHLLLPHRAGNAAIHSPQGHREDPLPPALRSLWDPLLAFQNKTQASENKPFFFYYM